MRDLKVLADNLLETAKRHREMQNKGLGEISAPFLCRGIEKLQSAMLRDGQREFTHPAVDSIFSLDETDQLVIGRL